MSMFRSYASTLKHFLIDIYLHSVFFYRKLNSEVRRKKDHKLDAPLCISLTSYPPRFGRLEMTIRSLLDQTVKFDKIELWISKNDISFLPKGVVGLKKKGLFIRECEDIKSFKKIIPSIEDSKEKYIVIADDDVYYPIYWLERLIDAYEPGTKMVVCHRARLIPSGVWENLPVYEQWPLLKNGPVTSIRVFPTGMGGVLYPPNIFDQRVTDQNIYMSLCPNADDIWLYFMALENNAVWRFTGTVNNLRNWRGTQGVALARKNFSGGYNNEQLNNVIKFLGKSGMINEY